MNTQIINDDSENNINTISEIILDTISNIISKIINNISNTQLKTISQKNNKIVNRIFNVDSNTIKNYIENIISNNNIDINLSNDLIRLLNITTTLHGAIYHNSFLREYIYVSKKIFDNFYLYQFVLKKLDNRLYSETNNEVVLFTTLLCFSFVFKVLSNYKNGKNNIVTEINCSKFFNQIILDYICPHFITYISDFPVDSYLSNFKMKTNTNHCIIYHYINSWKMNFCDKIYRIPDMYYLLHTLLKLKHKISQNIIDDILYNALFQVFYSILTMGSYEINHNDFRLSNILLHGNYIETDKYDLYIINYNNETLKYYLPNYGFKIKIIDYGLTHSEINSNLSNSNSVNYFNTNKAGIYPYYSDLSDQHYFINEILTKNIYIISPNIHEFLSNIVNHKFIGSNQTNKYLCEYWRLGFPYTISYFISKLKNDFIFDVEKNDIKSSKYNITEYSDTIIDIIKKICITKLNYDSNNKLIHDNELINNLVSFICYMSNVKNLNPSVYNILSEPFDNYDNVILKPIEIIKKFNIYSNIVSDDKIMNTYILNI